MKVVLLGLILLCTHLVFATSYTSTQSGDFNSAATWGGHGFPHSGDTWTIASGTTVTCSTTCAAGLAASGSCTVDGTVTSGGVLTIAPGATLTHSGELDVQHQGTVNINANGTSGAGTLIIAPGSGATCPLAFTTPGSGTPVLNMTGMGGSLGHNHFAVLSCNTALHGGAACTVTPESGGTYTSLNLNYFTISGFGNASTLAFNSFSVVSASIQNGLFNQNGNVRITLGSCGDCNFIVQNVSFTNPTDQINNTVFEFYGTAAQTGGTRTMQNVTAASHVLPVAYTANISLPGLKTGASFNGGDPGDINGFVGYNVALIDLTTDSLSQIFRNSAVILDTGGTQSVCYEFYYNSGLVFQDSFCLNRVPNQHEIVAATAATGGTSNLYQRYLCDGDGFYNADTGDMIQDWGTYTMKNSIGLNFCGTLSTISNSTTEVATLIENTNFNNFGETYCESGCYDGVHPVFRDNLIVKPADVNGTGVRGDDGVHAASVFVRQTNFSLDYNGFYQMPGSGDPGAEPQPPVPALLPNLTLGVPVSYVNIPGTIVGSQGNKLISTVTDQTHIGCATCNFTQAGAAGVMAGDFFEDITLEKVATVASVTDSTHLVLNSPGIAGMQQGLDGLTIFTSYWNHPGWVYGDSNNGSHDIHSNPLFVDSTRTLCTWYRLNSSVPVSCPTYGSVMAGASLLTATGGTGGTTITCSTCSFSAHGITNADVVRVFASTGQTVRGWSAISSVSPTSLTLASSIPGLAAGDTFDFITVTQGIGRALVEANGFDWNGNQVMPFGWGTVGNAMRYVYAGYAPRNFVYKHAGSPQDGFPDIGAVPVTGIHPDEDDDSTQR